MNPTIPKKPNIKVCGLTRVEDVLLARNLGADYAGFIFAKGTPRALDVLQARQLIEALHQESGATEKRIIPVGVFLKETQDEIVAIARTLNLPMVQLHGTSVEYFYDPDFHQQGFQVVPVVGIAPENQQTAPSLTELESVLTFLDNHQLKDKYPDTHHLLVDTAIKGQSGGTGQIFNHEHIFPYLAKARIMVAGGLNPDNFSGILQKFKSGSSGFPHGFDVSSGLEQSPRIKSPEKMKAFFAHLKDI